MFQIVGQVAEALDQTFVRLAFKTRGASARARAEATMERLEEATRVYAAAEAAGTLFPAPGPARHLRERVIRPVRGGDVADLSWPSEYCAASRSYDEWVTRCPNTRTAHARWLRHRHPSHALICLHGWGAGTFAFEEQAYRASWLYALGVDVVFVTLPFHARRANRMVGRPLFPSTDPFCSNDGFAQAVFDVRALMATLRQRGIGRIAVTGMSLGGFTSSLLATVEPTLEAAIPVIPFSSLPRVLWEHGEGTPAKRESMEEGLTFEKFEAAYAPTTPVRRPPALAGNRLLFIAGERDRVTPLSHAVALRDHFSRAPHRAVLEVFRGAHLIQTDRRALFRSMARFLAERQFIPRRD